MQTIPADDQTLKENSAMKEKGNAPHFSRIEKDRLDELIAKTSTDEMGLLDAIYVEEILNQRKHDQYYSS